MLFRLCSLSVAAALAACGNAADLVPLGRDPLEVIDRDGARELVVSPSRDVAAPENSDVLPPRALAVRDADGLHEPPAPSLTGALVDGGVAWVTTAGELVLERSSARDSAREGSSDGVHDTRDDMRVIARDVIPEIARRGPLLAFATSPLAAQPGLFVIDTRAPDSEARLLSRGLAVADRPLFIDDTTLVIVGARPSGVAGVWLADVNGGAPQPVTNAELRVPLAASARSSVVPPPADWRSMRVTRDEKSGQRALTYFDGATTRTVALP